jgi:hypothetical protein
MRLTKEGEKIFIDTFNRCAANFNNELLEFRQKIIEVMREHGDVSFINTEEDIKDWAISAFLAEVKMRHDHHNGQIQALDQAKQILKQVE